MEEYGAGICGYSQSEQPVQQAPQQAPQPQTPPPKWASRWGAIAIDSDKGVLGTTTGITDKSAAEQGAIADCRAKGGITCTLEIAYDNECASLVVSKEGHAATADSTVDKAVQLGMKTCANAGYHNCHAGYTACPTRADSIDMTPIKQRRRIKLAMGLTVVGACLWLSLASSAGATESASPSMCAKNEAVVFSCPLGKGGKVVSLCAARLPSQGETPYYYAYGRPSSPELLYPPKGQVTIGAFAHAHLVYGGANGGTAYSFVNGGYKYIVYSISGTGFDDGGVLVQRLGQTSAVRDMKCQRGKITESDDDKLINATQQWKSDTDLETHGLPSVH